MQICAHVVLSLVLPCLLTCHCAAVNELLARRETFITRAVLMQNNQLETEERNEQQV